LTKKISVNLLTKLLRDLKKNNKFCKAQSRNFSIHFTSKIYWQKYLSVINIIS